MFHVSLSCRQTDRICLYCYDMYLQLQNWMKLNVSRVSQLPTRMCPEFKHKSNVDLESASIATTYTYNYKIEWSSVFHVSLTAADKRVSTISTQVKCWYRICIYCYDMYLQLQNWMKLSVSQSFLVMSERLPTLSESSLQCWTVWKWILVISQSCIS